MIGEGGGGRIRFLVVVPAILSRLLKFVGDLKIFLQEEHEAGNDVTSGCYDDSGISAVAATLSRPCQDHRCHRRASNAAE